MAPPPPTPSPKLCQPNLESVTLHAQICQTRPKAQGRLKNLDRPPRKECAPTRCSRLHLRLHRKSSPRTAATTAHRDRPLEQVLQTGSHAPEASKATAARDPSRSEIIAQQRNAPTIVEDMTTIDASIVVIGSVRESVGKSRGIVGGEIGTMMTETDVAIVNEIGTSGITASEMIGELRILVTIVNEIAEGGIANRPWRGRNGLSRRRGARQTGPP